MKQEIVFMPLGGGQRVGASCYYLRLGEANIILDAGIGKGSGGEFEPDFHCLLTSPYIQSMSQIDQIFISHAHMDHVGCLLQLMSQSRYAAVYMTEMTKILAEYQLYDRVYLGKEDFRGDFQEDYRLAAQSLLERIVRVGYLQSIEMRGYRVSFFPAGHIPGAMMTLFDTGRRKSLYTGDYSIGCTTLTQGCMIPENLSIDTLILCGLHAKHPFYRKKGDSLYQTIDSVIRIVEQEGISVRCHVPQLSKGIEFLKNLDQWNRSGTPIYLDRSVMEVIEKIEALSVPILNKNHYMMGKSVPCRPHIYITSAPRREGEFRGFYRDVSVDFSLHEDFAEMKEFIKKINPKQAVIVHCGKARSEYDGTVEQEIMVDGECRTQFLFAEEKEMYKL